MSTALSALDLIIVGIYIAMVIFLGILSARKETSEEFLIAGRSLKTLSNASTILASKTGAGIMLTFVAMVYLYGVSAMWFFTGACSGYIIFIFFAVKLKKMSDEHEFYTLSDYFFHKFGKTVGFFSAVLILMVMLLALLMQLIGGAKILFSISGISYIHALLIIGITILIYMVLGGFKAVVRTDIAQLMAIIILLIIIGHVIGKTSVVSLIADSLSSGRSASFPSIASFYIFGSLVPFFSAELWQRIYAAKDANTVRKSLVLSALVYFVIGFLLMTIGLHLAQQLHGIDPDLALIAGFTRLLPAGFLGLGLVIFFAAIMSSADSYLFAGISILLQDFYARFKPLEKKMLVRLFRYAIAGVLGLSLFLSILLQSMVSITFLMGAFGSIIGLVGVASWLIDQIHPRTLICGMVTGFSGTFLLAAIEPVTETLVLNAIIFTIVGFLAGSMLNWIYIKIGRSRYERSHAN
jgi:Na+/proline symporter